MLHFSVPELDMSEWRDPSVCSGRICYDSKNFVATLEQMAWPHLKILDNFTRKTAVEDFEDYVFAATIPEPKTGAIVKDPSKFVAKKIAKGAEVSCLKS